MEKSPLWKIIVTYWLICLWLSCLWLSPAKASALTKSELQTTLQTFHGNNLLTKPIPSRLSAGIRLGNKIITFTKPGLDTNTRIECLFEGGTPYSPQAGDDLSLIFADDPNGTYWISCEEDNRTGQLVHPLTQEIVPLTVLNRQTITWEGSRRDYNCYTLSKKKDFTIIYTYTAVRCDEEQYKRLCQHKLPWYQALPQEGEPPLTRPICSVRDPSAAVGALSIVVRARAKVPTLGMPVSARRSLQCPRRAATREGASRQCGSMTMLCFVSSTL